MVYPVLSRRLGGISIGINTAPQKSCNFACLYCEVDFSQGAGLFKFDIDEADSLLRKAIPDAQRGRFGDAPIKAITLSGDGEPTALRDFEGVVRRVIATRDEFGLTGAKIVVISNASGLHRETVRRGLALMDGNNGELWAKLDAGTEDHFKLVAQTRVPFRRILDNLLTASQERPTLIQTCLTCIDGQMPSTDELGAYADRINHILANGGQVQAIQLYTIARLPTDTKGHNLSSLTEDQLNQVAQRLQPGIAVPIEVYD
ncbi:TPA: radical SAM protein [Candidatus Daviesbacteria bacterium]|nr:radical SAM protein [Candidatus Daviesbacteria bacterium]